MAQRMVYFPGFERCDFEEIIEKVGSGNPDEIEMFNQWMNKMVYLHNKNKPSWMVIYNKLEVTASYYHDDEIEHMLSHFNTYFEDLIRLVSFIFDPVEQEKVKQFFQEKLNECPAEVPI